VSQAPSVLDRGKSSQSGSGRINRRKGQCGRQCTEGRSGGGDVGNVCSRTRHQTDLLQTFHNQSHLSLYVTFMYTAVAMQRQRDKKRLGKHFHERNNRGAVFQYVFRTEML
jgi:hypothetical protein